VELTSQTASIRYMDLMISLYGRDWMRLKAGGRIQHGIVCCSESCRIYSFPACNFALLGSNVDLPPMVAHSQGEQPVLSSSSRLAESAAVERIQKTWRRHVTRSRVGTHASSAPSPESPPHDTLGRIASDAQHIQAVERVSTFPTAWISERSVIKYHRSQQ
jgi:hypothetical protein